MANKTGLDKVNRDALLGHYEWCVKEGRCLLWAKELFSKKELKEREVYGKKRTDPRTYDRSADNVVKSIK